MVQDNLEEVSALKIRIKFRKWGMCGRALKKIFNVLHEILNVKEERVNVRLTL